MQKTIMLMKKAKRVLPTARLLRQAGFHVSAAVATPDEEVGAEKLQKETPCNREGTGSESHFE